MFKDKIIRLLSVVLVGVLILLPSAHVAFGIDPDATTITYETENNDTYSDADVTYDDENNYGTISSADDVDWWYVIPTSDGMANFWLGEIPSGCNYDLTLYKGNGTTPILTSNNSGRTQELLRCHVYANQIYLIRINSASGYSSSSYYKFRYKNSALGSAKFFTTNLNGDSTGYPDGAEDYIRNMGFNYIVPGNNQSALVVRTNLASRDICVVCTHGLPGELTLRTKSSTIGTTRLFGKTHSNMVSNDVSIEALSSGALSESELILYFACYAGVLDSQKGNLVDETLNKGARCCIGWTETIQDQVSAMWLETFFNYCSQGYNLYIAMYLTNNAVRNAFPEAETGYSSQYYGSSPMTRTILALQYQ